MKKTLEEAHLVLDTPLTLWDPKYLTRIIAELVKMIEKTDE
jgi:hypothetical protein